ncbi:NAD(P)-binding protein [Penicillium capsulatum]|uniref:NAD(P)-binding protein n=1 Tax=Penicillium capsulatum TaxID=69766 RepID=A0A9W9I2M1_9EURO|nr:NAD(P)-binding protein [Penicillium capsulatum]KAJ6117358.1 NAD(P)-binding protein [Penicillium capsulatum]
MSLLGCTTVWLVTGCSSGLGKSIANTVYQAGHCIVATARDVNSLSYLPGNDSRVLKLSLDVTSPESITDSMREAVAHFKKIDVVINNAGYGLLGEMEAIPETEARRLMDTNFWGPVNVTKAALQLFRENDEHQTTKTIVQISSMGGWITAPGHSFYHARYEALSEQTGTSADEGSKFALEGFTESVAKEIGTIAGINFLIAEPSGMHTGFAESALEITYRHPVYNQPDSPLNFLIGHIANPENRKSWSDPDRCAAVLFDCVVGQKKRAMPKRLVMGHGTIDLIQGDIQETIGDMDAWREETERCGTSDQTVRVGLE